MTDQTICIFPELFAQADVEVSEVINICKQQNLRFRQVTEKSEVQLLDAVVFSINYQQFFNTPLEAQMKIDLRLFRTFGGTSFAARKCVTGFNFLPLLLNYEVVVTGFANNRVLKSQVMQIIEGFSGKIAPPHQNIEEFCKYLDLCRKSSKPLIVIVHQPYQLMTLLGQIDDDQQVYMMGKVVSETVLLDLQLESVINEPKVVQIINDNGLCALANTKIRTEKKPKITGFSRQLIFDTESLPYQSSRIALVYSKQQATVPDKKRLYYYYQQQAQPTNSKSQSSNPEGIKQQPTVIQWLQIPKYCKKSGHNLVTHCQNTFGEVFLELNKDTLFYSYSSNFYVVIYKQELVNLTDSINAMFNQNNDIQTAKKIKQFCSQMQQIPYSKLDQFPQNFNSRLVFLFDYKTSFKHLNLTSILTKIEAEHQGISFRPMLWLYLCYIKHVNNVKLFKDQVEYEFEDDASFERQFDPFPERDSETFSAICHKYYAVPQLSQPMTQSSLAGIYEEDVVAEIINISEAEKTVIIGSLVQLLNQDKLAKKERFKPESLKDVVLTHIFQQMTLHNAIQAVKNYDHAEQSGNIGYSTGNNQGTYLSNVHGFSDGSTLYKGDEQNASICIADQFFTDQE